MRNSLVEYIPAPLPVFPNCFVIVKFWSVNFDLKRRHRSIKRTNSSHTVTPVHTSHNGRCQTWTIKVGNCLTQHGQRTSLLPINTSSSVLTTLKGNSPKSESIRKMSFDSSFSRDCRIFAFWRRFAKFSVLPEISYYLGFVF